MTGPAAEGMIPGCEDDVALVVRALAGDRAAFGTLVDRYEEPVRRVARAVLRDVHDADGPNDPPAETQQQILRFARVPRARSG